MKFSISLLIVLMTVYISLQLFDDTTAADQLRPNIVLILCDDLGYSDVGFNGAKDIRTPSLDQLANNGTVFTSAYVPHPFCGPSRMGMMTGRYPHTFGAPFNLPNSGIGLEAYNKQGVDVSQPLISTVLQDAGYYTGAVGKWHMGTASEFHPNNRGFDEYYGFLGGGHDYFPDRFEPIYERQVRAGKKLINDYLLPLERNGKEVRETEYITDALSREAVAFVEKASSDERPFFLYLAYNAPHTPLQAKDEDLKVYANIKDEKRRTYAAMVHAVDRGVGELVSALDRSNQLENTLVVFLSDNGGKLSEGATNTPLREGKGSAYEGGFRVPMLFHWPGSVPANSRYAHPVSALDFYPTFARLAKATIPDKKRLDGADIWTSFQAGESPRRGQMIYAMRHRNGFSDVGARRDDWKVSRVGRGPWKLFNVSDDLGEQKDLSSDQPDVTGSMVSAVENWSHDHTEPLWFHDAAARDEWEDTGMPNHDERFRLE